MSVAEKQVGVAPTCRHKPKRQGFLPQNANITVNNLIFTASKFDDFKRLTYLIFVVSQFNAL